MKILLFGGTGMVGQGVLRECLLAPDVELVRTIGRTSIGVEHGKLDQLVRPNLLDYSPVEPELTGFDACFFVLGVSSAGMSTDAYTQLTYDLTIAAATTLSRLNPGMVFIYVSGAGTDSSEKGRMMWARVKGRTENALLRLPFRAAYMFRPGIIQPLHGARSKTGSYRVLYALLAHILPFALRLFPNSILTTEQVGRAMLNIALEGANRPILEARDIRRYAER